MAEKIQSQGDHPLREEIPAKPVEHAGNHHQVERPSSPPPEQKEVARTPRERATAAARDLLKVAGLVEPRERRMLLVAFMQEYLSKEINQTARALAEDIVADEAERLQDRFLHDVFLEALAFAHNKQVDDRTELNKGIQEGYEGIANKRKGIRGFLRDLIQSDTAEKTKLINDLKAAFRELQQIRNERAKIAGEIAKAQSQAMEIITNAAKEAKEIVRNAIEQSAKLQAENIRLRELNEKLQKMTQRKPGEILPVHEVAELNKKIDAIKEAATKIGKAEPESEAEHNDTNTFILAFKNLVLFLQSRGGRKELMEETSFKLHEMNDAKLNNRLLNLTEFIQAIDKVIGEKKSIEDLENMLSTASDYTTDTKPGYHLNDTGKDHLRKIIKSF